MEEIELRLIVKVEEYIEYMLNVLLKLPRVEKYNIGNMFKELMYDMLNNVVYLNKVRENRIGYCNKADADILLQRIYIRLMYKFRYIDEKKRDRSIYLLDELGKMIGGYVKSLGIRHGKEK